MTYEIKQIKSTFFSTVVYAISFENPLQELSSISRELTSIIHKPCNVLFDLLLSNGDEFNRFVLGKFDGTNIDYDSLRIIDLENAGFVEITTKKNTDLVTGFITKDGSVEKVSINGDSDFEEGDIFSEEAAVVVTYHTFEDKD